MAEFTVASALAEGRTRNELRRVGLDQSIWGVRRDSGPSATFPERCRMLALRLPGVAFFSHTTAALLWGAPLDLRFERASAVHVSVPAPGRAPHARGIRGHELEVLPSDVAASHGVRCSSPARTWCDLASLLSLRDLVAVGDYLIHWRAPLASIAELEAMARRFQGKRGMSRIREALPLLSDRAESRPESHLRVILQLAGMPGPAINLVIVDAETGKEVRTDFAFEELKLVLEYQGDYHRTKAQWRKDMTRRSKLEAAGWKVMELNWDDLKDPDELVARIRARMGGR
jgi:hypothetical protein